DIDELITTKLEKESKRYIKQFEGEKIAIENGRWGPFIRFGKLMLKLGRREDGNKWTAEDAAELTLEEVKKMITDQMPDAFEKKTSKKSKAPGKAATKKTAAKKTAAKKSAPRKK